MKMEDKKRQIAIKIGIKEIIFGKYVKQEGWEPNYILTDNNIKVSRANIIGVIVSKNDDGLVIDDSNATISMKSFDTSINYEDFNIGDTVQVIGRPREFENSKYFAIEIIKKIDSLWLKVRQKELDKIEHKPINDEVVVDEIVVSNDYDDIISKIKQKDSGEGVYVDDLVTIGIKEEFIKKLIENGEVFEISPGKIKILE